MAEVFNTIKNLLQEQWVAYILLLIVLKRLSK